jgi:hypothetical protein
MCGFSDVREDKNGGFYCRCCKVKMTPAWLVMVKHGQGLWAALMEQKNKS